MARSKVVDANLQSLFKASCDQGYVVYKRVCEVEQEAREAVAGGSPAGGTRNAQRTKVKPMSHFDFLQKIAEGFVIEAYNSTKNREDEISLESYSLKQIERAMAEMRGLEQPSSKALGTGAAAGPATHATAGARGGKAVKRRIQVR